MRHFQVTFTDRDGEEHIYHLAGENLWEVLIYVHVRMTSEGDFYGQVRSETVDLNVAELIAAPPSPIHEIVVGQ